MATKDLFPLITERKYSFKGIFKLEDTYKFLKDFLENSRFYDVSEKDFEEKIEGDSKSLKAKIEAEQMFNDYYKVIIRYGIEMKGKEINTEINGRIEKLIDGTAKLIVNVYLQPDYQNKKPKPALLNFLDKVYNKYIGKDEMALVAMSASKDVKELISRFKQNMNMELK